MSQKDPIGQSILVFAVGFVIVSVAVGLLAYVV